MSHGTCSGGALAPPRVAAKTGTRIALSLRMAPYRAPRIPGFDYVGFHRYFLTICVFPRRPVFADFTAGAWVRDELLRTADRFEFALTAYCVMHDHVHVLAEGT